MDNELALRKRVQSAIHDGTLPAKRPDRSWAGPGIGFPCALCAQPIRRHHREIQIQLEQAGPVPGLDTFHLHLQCFAVWGGFVDEDGEDSRAKLPWSRATHQLWLRDVPSRDGRARA